MVKGHLKLLNKVFQVGDNLEEAERDRVRRAKELSSTTIPILSLLCKDHKEVAPGEFPKIAQSVEPAPASMVSCLSGCH